MSSQPKNKGRGGGPKTLTKKQARKFKQNLNIARGNPRAFSGMNVKRIKGRGNFWTDAKDWLIGPREGQQSRVNEALSGVGGAFFGEQGAKAGSYLSKLLGMGNYSVEKNSLVHPACVENMPYVRRPPTFGSTSKGSDIELCHQEFVGDIISSTGFNVKTYVNNPGNPVLFPWLSQFAQYYELFEWIGIVYYYKSTSSSVVNSLTGAMGSVVIASDYDCVDTAFPGKREMENTEYASSAVPYQEFIHPIECDPKRNVAQAMSYVIPGITSVGDATKVNNIVTDPRMAIPCTTSVAVSNCAASGGAIGELWVSYHVRLSRPVLEQTSSPAFTQKIEYSNAGVGTLKNTFTGPVGFTFSGGGGYARISNPGGVLPGRYLVTVRYDGTGVLTLPATAPTMSNWSYPPVVLNNTTSFNSPITRASDGYIVSFHAVIDVSNTAGNFEFTAPGGWSGTTGYVYITITSFNSLLTSKPKTQAQRLEELEQLVLGKTSTSKEEASSSSVVTDTPYDQTPPESPVVVKRINKPKSSTTQSGGP